MKLLLDTQALFWWFSDPKKLSSRSRSVIENGAHAVLVSPAVASELAIKTELGKLDALPLIVDLPSYVSEEGFTELPITMTHATRAGLLPLHHRDPFDRLLVAQAQELGIPIVSSDRLLDRYGIQRIW